jgi:AcrR family transcriptional regulator
VKANSTRQLIIKVAADLFARNGVRLTTMEAIAIAAGRGRRTVYMYFSDKAEIYNAVVDTEIEHICNNLKDVVYNDGQLTEVLHKYAFERYNCINSLMRRNVLLVRDFVQNHNRIERLRERLYNEELKVILPYFEKAVNRELPFSDYPPEILSITFLNLLRGNDRILTLKNNQEESIRLINAACDIFIKGALS